jgi:hypothetical protein
VLVVVVFVVVVVRAGAVVRVFGAALRGAAPAAGG